jgi:hypothetical protein
MPSAMTRSEFQRFAFGLLDEVIGLSYNKKATEYTTVYNVKSSDSAFEEDHQVVGYGLPIETAENAPIPTDRMYDGLAIRYDHRDWTLRAAFSHQFIRDMKRDLWNDRARDFGYSFSQGVELSAADLFNGGFTVPGYDKVPLFSPAHPLGARTGGSAGQTQSNVLATAATLTVGSLRDMLTQSRLFLDPTGVRRIQVNEAILLVPPQLEFQAKEIIKSAGRPDTANRADNVTRDAVRVVVWDYLNVNPKFWFMIPEKSQHKLKFFWRERFHTFPFYDDITRTNWIGGAQAYSLGYSDYLPLLGTNPT